MESRTITLDSDMWNLLTLIARIAGVTEEEAIAKLIAEDQRRRSAQDAEVRREQRLAIYAQNRPDVTALPLDDPYLDYIRQKPHVEQDPDWRP